MDHLLLSLHRLLVGLLVLPGHLQLLVKAFHIAQRIRLSASKLQYLCLQIRQLSSQLTVFCLQLCLRLFVVGEFLHQFVIFRLELLPISCNFLQFLLKLCILQRVLLPLLFHFLLLLFRGFKFILQCLKLRLRLFVFAFECSYVYYCFL